MSRACWIDSSMQNRTLATPRDVQEFVDQVLNDALRDARQPMIVADFARDCALRAMRAALVAGGADQGHVNEHLFEKTPLRGEATNAELAALERARFDTWIKGVSR